MDVNKHLEIRGEVWINLKDKYFPGLRISYIGYTNPNVCIRYLYYCNISRNLKKTTN